MVTPAVEGLDLFNIAGRSMRGMEKTIWEVVGGERR